MAEKTDYSPVVEAAGDAEKRRERRKWGALLTGAHVFWIYAAILAGIILLVIYLTGRLRRRLRLASDRGDLDRRHVAPELLEAVVRPRLGREHV
jgi:hypothetical protein